MSAPSNPSTAGTTVMRPALTAVRKPSSHAGACTFRRQLGRGSDRRAGQPVGSQVAEDLALGRPGHRVGHAQRNVVQWKAENLHRNAQPLALVEVRGRARGDANPCRAALDQMEGQLGAGDARAHDEDVLSHVRRRVDVVTGVDQVAGEGLPSGPVGQVGIVVETGGHHHRGRVDDTVVAAHLPMAVDSIDPLDHGVEADVELVVSGVVLEVPDPLVPRGVLAVSAPARTEAGLGGHPAGGVEAQGRVAGAPAGGHLVRALEHDDVGSGSSQSRTGSEPGRSRPADHGVNHRAKGTVRRASLRAKRLRRRAGPSPGRRTGW